MESACSSCALPECICADIDALPCSIEILVVRHFVERHKISGSARLVPLAVSGASVLDVGGPTEPPRTELEGAWVEQRSHLDPVSDASGTYLLFPGGRPIESVSPPVSRLVVPDGTWAQTRRMRMRIPMLAQLPTVSVSAEAPPTRTLRAARQSGELPTAVAIARALRETGNSGAADALLVLYERMAEILTKPSRGPR